jgi:hypothetical protein
MMKAFAVLAILVLPFAHAQESASFEITGSDLNAAGRPRDGSTAVSASFQLSLGALATTSVGRALTSPSFRSDAGFLALFVPPREVAACESDAPCVPCTPDAPCGGSNRSLHVGNPTNPLDKTTLTWPRARTAILYNLYRGERSSPSGFDPGYGTCRESDLRGESTEDPGVPPAGHVFFLLVTGEDRLAREGTKGHNSVGQERPNPNPCP